MHLNMANFRSTQWQRYAGWIVEILKYFCVGWNIVTDRT